MPLGTEVALTPGLSTLERLYIKVLGVPILGLRVRARTILRLLEAAGTPQRIVDAGSGRGVMVLACARRFPDATVLGVDLLEQQNALNNAIAQQLGLSERVTFETWDVMRLPELGTFDLIISSDTLEHLEDDLSGVTMFRQALNPGGRLLVHVPHLTRNVFGWHRQNWMDIEGHVRPGYTKEGLTALLQQGGLHVQQCVYNYNSLETLANDLSKLITGAKERNKGLYALAFPLLMLLVGIGALYQPKRDGSGLVALAVRED
ncbi:MAG: cyclopropane-fatty-acyl-phospholipid synthase family protein [Candidatus Tectimicrobiota bacterium]